MHLSFSRWIIWVTEKQPLVNKTVIPFFVDQAKIKPERSNQGIGNDSLGIEHLEFSYTIKHFIRTFLKVEEKDLVCKERAWSTTIVLTQNSCFW